MTPENNKKTPPQASKKVSKPAQTAAQPTAPPRPRKYVLTKVQHVRSEISRLYGECRRKEIDVNDASKLANMLGILHRIIADSDLETRMAKIEKQLRATRG